MSLKRPHGGASENSGHVTEWGQSAWRIAHSLCLQLGCVCFTGSRGSGGKRREGGGEMGKMACISKKCVTLRMRGKQGPHLVNAHPRRPLTTEILVPGGFMENQP